MTLILDDLRWRYATKKFDTEKKLSTEQLETIKEALRMTPSSYGLQPWKFILVENSKIRSKLTEYSWGQKQIYDASHLLVMCRVENIDQKFVDTFLEDVKHTTGKTDADIVGYKTALYSFADNLDSQRAEIWAEKQIYIALGNIMTVLAGLRIDSCPMEGFDRSKYDEILELSEKGLASCVILPIGFRMEDDTYSSNKKVRFKTSDLFIEI